MLVDFSVYDIYLVSFNSLDAFPVVVAHLQFATDIHSQPDSQTITDQDIQNPGIPPTLRKIRQQVRKRHLQYTLTHTVIILT